MEKPWRVTIIRANRQTSYQGSTFAEQNMSEKRKRNGKKRRILIRKRVATRTQEDVRRRQSQAEKEIAEREKRTIRNREKKVKRKLKDKMKKSQKAEEIE